MDRFVFSWIVLNHYYATYAEEHPDPSWTPTQVIGDKAELEHFIKLPLHASVWKRFGQLHDVKGRRIPLPLKDQKGRDVPDGLAAPTELDPLSLGYASFLRVLYQIRCQFFHGERGVRTFEDQRYQHFASDPCHEYVKLLIMETPLKQ